jgi:hypothetical protein
MNANMMPSHTVLPAAQESSALPEAAPKASP